MSFVFKVLWLIFILHFAYKIQTEEIQVATKDEPVKSNNSAPISKLRGFYSGYTDGFSGINCDYFVKRNTINCNRLVECDNAFIHLNISSLDTSKVFKYGIGVLPNQENVVLPELIKFYLYPKFNETSYQNHTIQVGNRFHRISIYFAKDYFDDGIRFSDLKCYEKLVAFFKKNHLTHKQMIKVHNPYTTSGNLNIFGFVTLYS